MEASEVMIDKTESNAASVEPISQLQENNDTPVIIENSSPTSEIKAETHINSTLISNCVPTPSENTNNCNEILVKETSLEEQIHNDEKDKETSEPIQDDTSNSMDHEKKDTDKQPIIENSKKIVSSIIGNIAPPCINDTKVSSLGSIALEYGNSDSEVEDITPDVNTKENNTTGSMDVQLLSYRSNKQNSSSSDEYDSEEDSSSSSVSSVSVVSDDSDDDRSRKKNAGSNVRNQKTRRMKNELDDLPPIEDLKITVPEVLCDPLGEVAWMVEQLVVVRPKPGKPTLNLDTILFIEKGRRTLGKIFDVFGQVSEPHYCVRFNSSDHIQECEIKVGMTVYYCPNTEYTSLVFLCELMTMKGSDAVGEDEPPEFSDDEEERAYYEKLKQTQAKNKNNTDVPSKRRRTGTPKVGWQSNHPWNRNTVWKGKNGPRVQRDSGTVSSTTNDGLSHNSWSPVLYQNKWPPSPRYMYPPGSEQYGYGSYPSGFQSMPFANPFGNNADQNFQNSQHNCPPENSAAATPNPRIPFNTRPTFPPGFQYGQNRPNFSNPRFRYPGANWQSHVPAASVRMNTPWVSLPPPPPPPPSTDNS